MWKKYNKIVKKKKMKKISRVDNNFNDKIDFSYTPMYG